MSEVSFQTNPDFINVLRAINSVLDEATFVADSDGLLVSGMDPAHISYVKCHIAPTFFHSYEAMQTSFSINLTNLLKILRRIDANTLSFSVANNKLHITAETYDEKKQIELPLLETSAANTARKLSIEFTASFRINPKALDKILDTATYFGAYVQITVNPPNVEFKTKNEWTGSFTLVFNGQSYQIDAKNPPVSSAYSHVYLSKIISALKTFDEIEIHLAEKKPMLINVPLPSAELLFYIAPRLE